MTSSDTRAFARGSDVAVVGAGIVGLATAYELVRVGASVTVYERGRPGGGQSAGDSRIFRHSHADPRLVEHTAWARQIWREWSDELGAALISADGAVALGANVEARLAILDTIDGVAAHRIDAAELHDRLPLLAPYDGPAMLDETGGSIRAAASIDALAATVRSSLVPEEVLTLQPLPGGTVEVRTPTIRGEHDYVVVCAGRETPRLARGVGIALPVQVSALVRVSFAPSAGAPPTLATLQDSSGAFGETGVYAAASPDNSRYGVGLADAVPVSDDGRSVDPDALAAIVTKTIEYVRRALPGLDPTPLGYIHCWGTSLPWGSDGLAVWEADRVAFIAGDNLFKQAPALGRSLARLATGEALPETLQPTSRLGHA